MKSAILLALLLAGCSHASHSKTIIDFQEGWRFEVPNGFHLTQQSPLSAAAVSDEVHHDVPVRVFLQVTSGPQLPPVPGKIEVKPMPVVLDGKKGMLTVFSRSQIVLGFRFDYPKHNRTYVLKCEGSGSVPLRLALQCRRLLQNLHVE